MDISWKASVRAALKNAATDGRVSRCAREIGVNKGSLHTFCSEGRLGTDRVHAVAKWLVEKGYLERPKQDTPMSQAAPMPQETERLLIAKELRLIADWFESDASIEDAKRRLTVFVNTCLTVTEK